MESKNEPNHAAELSASMGKACRLIDKSVHRFYYIDRKIKLYKYG